MRTLDVDDLFRIEQLGRYFGGPFSCSPNGQALAYVLQRPKATATMHKQDFLIGNDRADIWLVDLPAGTPRKLTNGIADDVGYWAPSWSPDGRRLAMLSTQGGNVTLWVWERMGSTLDEQRRIDQGADPRENEREKAAEQGYRDGVQGKMPDPGSWLAGTYQEGT